MQYRASGVLLHATSLPSPGGVGDLGPWAWRFAELLAGAGQAYWQVLPLSPTSTVMGSSPYSSDSAFAGNALLVSHERLVEEGFLERSDVPPPPAGDPSKADFEAAGRFKRAVLDAAYERCRNDLPRDPDYARFLAEHGYWLDDYALFTVLKEIMNGQAWCDWPGELRDRDPAALEYWRGEARQALDRVRFGQYLFFRQWDALKRRCGKLGLRVMGDAPIYVTYDSADVWAHPELFQLDEARRPVYVAGVPPDYFSKTGQRWGNPVYDWEPMRGRGFPWWTARIGHNLGLYDLLRLDHFRGFAAFWRIPAHEETAVNGEWIDTPGRDLFTHLRRRFGSLPIIAEDLGHITPDVRELKRDFAFPGMKILQFGFFSDPGTSLDLPHNWEQDCVAYTGTHDNNTTRGWFERDAGGEAVERLARYLGRDPDHGRIHVELMRLVMASVANTAIIPMQDVLGLGAEARMNTPAVANGNWSWRLLPEQMEPDRLAVLADMSRLYGRC